MTTFYVANDGKQFTCERECLDYEYRLKSDVGADLVIGRDSDGYIVDFTNPDFFEEADFISCKNGEGVLAVQRRAAYLGFYPMNINKPGSYYWDEDAISHLPIQPLLEEAKERVALLELVINDCN